MWRIQECYKCSYCFVTQDKFARKKHEEAVHEKKQQKYKCEECAKSYSNKNSLSYHMRTKHAKQDIQGTSEFSRPHFSNRVNDKSFDTICPRCNKKFTFSHHMKRHMREVHQVNKRNFSFVPCNNLDEYTCSHCEAGFERKENLSRHIEVIHSDSPAIECPKCPVEFTRKDNFERHMRRKHSL